MEKGKHNYINYGFYSRKRVMGSKRNIRKAYRYIRKWGFDPTELWNLDATILRYLADKFGDEWNDLCKSRNESVEIIDEAWNKQFNNKITDLIQDKNKYAILKAFVLPRLKKFKNHIYGFPCAVGSDEEWQNILNKIIKEFEEDAIPEVFVKYFVFLWD